MTLAIFSIFRYKRGLIKISQQFYCLASARSNIPKLERPMLPLWSLVDGGINVSNNHTNIHFPIHKIISLVVVSGRQMVNDRTYMGFSLSSRLRNHRAGSFFSLFCFQECPEGVVHEDSFKDIYAKFFPHGSEFQLSNSPRFCVIS